MIESKDNETRWLVGLIIILGMFACDLIAVLAMLPGSPIGRLFDAFFGGANVPWYITRSSGLLAYLLLWLSTAWGIAVSGKLGDSVLNRFVSYDLHEYLSLLALGFLFLHIAILVIDQHTPFSIAQLLIPFIASYRPIWIGVGVIGTYLAILVSITFYIRRWIGYRNFRVIHYASFAGYVAALAHSFFAGTDSTLVTTQLMYAITTLIVVFLFMYRLMMAWMNRALAPKMSPH